MMDRREALLLIERLKRRTRDLEVLALCEHVEHERVNAVAFRRPGDAVNAPTVNAPQAGHRPQRYGRVYAQATGGAKGAEGKVSDEPAPRVIWSPRGNRAQVRLLKCQVFEIFFGGARGGGKTDGVLGEFGAHASRYGKDAIGLMVRRTRAELVETIERSRAIYGPLEWEFNETEKMWRAPDGARLRFAYLERDADADCTRATATREFILRKSATSPILPQS